MHVDTANTHIFSGIANVDQCSRTPWPLDILGHGGTLHSVRLQRTDTAGTI